MLVEVEDGDEDVAAHVNTPRALKPRPPALALVLAAAQMAVNADGVPQRTLNMTVWLRSSNCNQSARQSKQASCFTSGPRRNSIDVKEWTLGLRDVLRFDFDEYTLALATQARGTTG